MADGKQKAAELQARVEELQILRDNITSGIEELPEQQQVEAFHEYQGILDDIDREYRITRSEYDILYFGYEYFSDDRNPENDDNLIPAGVSIDDAPDFHHELCAQLQEQSLIRLTKKFAWASPRGSGKTMWNTNIYPLHELVYKKRQFILVISETADLSKHLIKYIGEQLKYNEKLRKDFGELLSPSKMQNDTDNLEAFVTNTGAMVKAASTGKAIRGARNGSVRPDLIICDDLESMENTNTPESREKNLHWYNSVVVPVGTPEKTGIIYMGTMVHGSGLLPDVLGRADYESRVYSSFLEEPEYPELWQQYEDILLDKEVDNRDQLADEFYSEHKELMDLGTATLWEKRFPYRELIKKKVEIGSRAFASEYLNRPSDPDSQIFNENIVGYFKHDPLFDEHGRKRNLDIYSFWDIAIGRTKRSDYNAIVTIARDRRTGIIYVIDAWAAKVPVHKAMEVAVEKILEFKPRMFGVESVQAQYEMYRQLQQRCIKEGIYGTRIKPVNPTSKKEERIELLEPLFENGYLKIKTTQRLLKEQLEQFPNGDYDDLPDALASCVNLAGTRTSRTHQKKPEGT